MTRIAAATLAFVVSGLEQGDLRKPCREFYPPPAGSESWTGCESAGRSPCGGPEQCACGAGQRLVTLKCTQGTKHVCRKDEGCTQTMNSAECGTAVSTEPAQVTDPIPGTPLHRHP
jgi:hypothetical protein